MIETQIDLYIFTLIVAGILFIASRVARASFINVVNGVFLFVIGVYMLKSVDATFGDMYFLFVSILFILGAYALFDGAVGVVYE